VHFDRATLARAVPLLAAVLLLAAFPAFGAKFYVDMAVKIMILAIFAMSLELLVGQTGLVSFGHAAFFGIAAYVAALLTPKDGAASLWLLLPASIGAAAAYAFAVGALSLRTRGVYFIMITLAFAQMAYYVFHDTPIGGGSDGLLAIMLRSRYGHALAGIRVNEQRMRAAGFPTYAYKLGAFVLAAAFAGLAGFLHALKDGYVNPEILSWHQSGAVLLMVILGGIGSLRGAILGAFAFTMLQELFQWQAIFGSFAKHWQLMLGLTIIAFVATLPRGLVGLADRLRRRHG
jgi:branched-chain amino acid transport system permease protein